MDFPYSQSILIIARFKVSSKKKFFDLASPRLQRLREKIAMYTFQVCWVTGKTHLIADALSRAPLFVPEELPGLKINTAISCLFQTSQPAIRVIYDVATIRRREVWDHHLDLFSVAQAVYLQDSKSSVGDKPGFIVSMRPDRLSYVVNVDNRFFTRPRRLLRPVTPDTPFSVASPTPPSSPPVL